MNREQANIIISHIRANNNADLSKFVKFKTDTTVGYVPDELVECYIKTGDFEYDSETLRFAEGVNGFEGKSNAMQRALNHMLETDLINKKPDHYKDQFYGIGDFHNPEFRIDGAYYHVFGLPITAFSLQMHTVIDGKSKILLQKRVGKVLEPNTYDFATGGGLPLPENNLINTAKQRLNSAINPDVLNDAKHVSTVLLSRESPAAFNPEILTREASVIPLYAVEIPFSELRNMAFDDDIELVSPNKVLEYCANGQISDVMVQSFMASLIATGLMPDSEFVPEIKQELVDGGCQFTTEQKAVLGTKPQTLTR